MSTTTVVWHNVPLVNASGSLTSDGTRLLECELKEDRLALITIIGPPSTRIARNELMSKILGQVNAAYPSSDDESLTLLASIAYHKDDFYLLILDTDTTNSKASAALSGLGQLAGAFCALSSLVISCYDEIGSIECIAPRLPQFQSLFQTLIKEFVTIEVFDMLPNLLSIDWSLSCSLADKLNTEKENQVKTMEALKNLIRFKQLGVFYPRTIVQMNFDDFVGAQTAVKRLFGLEMTGKVLCGLLRKLCLQMQEQKMLDFGTACDDFVEDKCRVLAEDALNMYLDCVHPAVLEHPPMELDVFKQLHEEICRLSMDYFHSASKYKSTKYQTARNKLKADIRLHYETELQILTHKSREFCEEIRHTLWADLIAQATRVRGGGAFTAILLAIQDFDKKFNEKASGPAKFAILRDFYKIEAIQAFQQLENAVTQQLSEQRIEQLRIRLETDFDEKKMALVEHFMHKEDELRTGMARDMETMQKMQEAKVARAKIDGSETKRLRDDLNERKRQNMELQKKVIILQHAQEDASNQKAILATQVVELENAVQREIASRTELVDTLALTINKAKQQENALNKKIADLQLESKEKVYRIESDLQEVAQQLRKTNEEKKELQNKLNEFILKVTALPEVLQQHLFCMESDDRVYFADALTSFMS